MALIKEFRDFAIKGNVMDLAIGVIIGAAFNSIVKSLVEDIITPLLLTPALKAAHLENLSQLVIKGTAIKYGNFISNIISFIIVAFVLFLIVKGVNAARKRHEDAPAEPTAPTTEEKLLMEIRDAIKSANSNINRPQ
jgi:large conductance mechanosensitive channel